MSVETVPRLVRSYDFNQLPTPREFVESLHEQYRWSESDDEKVKYEPGNQFFVYESDSDDEKAIQFFLESDDEDD
jgi:hypothetical protein